MNKSVNHIFSIVLSVTVILILILILILFCHFFGAPRHFVSRAAPAINTTASVTKLSFAPSSLPVEVTKPTYSVPANTNVSTGSYKPFHRTSVSLISNYLNPLTKLSPNKTCRLGSHTVTVAFTGTDDDITSKITIDGKAFKVSGAYEAYGVSFNRAKSGIILNMHGFEQEKVEVYLICANGTLMKAKCYTNMSIVSQQSDALIIHEQVDCFGTWTVERQYRVSSMFRLMPISNIGFVQNEYVDDLRVVHDVCAKKTDGSDTLLTIDSFVRVKYIIYSDSLTACLRDEPGNEYLVERVETPQGYVVSTPDGMLSEYMCFDNMPYCG